MIGLEDKPQYYDIDPDFKPLPKYGHLSEKTAEFLEAEPFIAAGYDLYWNQPDIPSFREAAGDPDAVMPPGAPGRYSEVKTELLHFPARDGHLVELKVYKSPNVSPEATLVYRMHGGGFCVGRHEVDGAENVYAATNTDIIVISVDYRMAPEHPFPKPVEDCWDGLLWCKANAKSLGINPEKIMVAGSSAGANLSAVLSLLAREERVTGIIAQVLHFPTVCHPKFLPRATYELGSHIQNTENAVLSSVRYDVFLGCYIPDPSSPDYRHSPLLASSFEGLPPTLIQSAGVDIFRDEGFAYADALGAGGVDVEMHCYKGVPHCFPAVMITNPETPVFYARFNAFLKKHATSGCQ
ncbi:alpha/beta hydrolase fold-domain-containing protein [Xylaria cf. heliscus]|nr:alpha/beta hydrolase fold-domain-containing protein [Xylaria cf. heliscus]